MGDEIRMNSKQKVTVSDIAKFLGLSFWGNDVQVETVRSLDNACKHSIVFSKREILKDLIESVEEVCFITSSLPDNIGKNAFIVAENPRLAFAKSVSRFFVSKKPLGIGLNSVIHPSVRIGKNVTIGNACTIGKNVIIGDETEIRNNVVIAEGVSIGEYCLIKSNTVVGEKGFGFDFEKDGTPVEFPQLGNVRIGNYVEIGALNTVVRGALSDTIINSYVKTDDHVHIGHNCVIGAKSIITACSEISGSVYIGERCWLGPNCSIMNKVTLGDDCYIGLGAVVIEDVLPGSVMVGNPAIVLRKRGIKE